MSGKILRKGCDQTMEQHIKILGIMNIIWGAISALGGLAILIIFGGAYGIVEMVSREQSTAAIALPFIALIGGAMSLLLLLLSAPSIIAGIGLLQRKSWAKTLAIILSVLHLFNIPLGTALGIYGLWVLNSPQIRNSFVTH